VTWFANEILPLIRHSMPTAQFHIVGANPAPAVQALAKIKDVHVTGRVPDVRPYLANATAAVAPMRIARGIQNKVLEAMAMARPVIVTSDALEGIAARPDIELLLADTAEAFAATAHLLAANVMQGQRIGEAARQRVVTDYSWEGRLGAFDRLLGP
jgi:glycosyltransferase involved in cell wall biosynthesis